VVLKALAFSTTFNFKPTHPKPAIKLYDKQIKKTKFAYNFRIIKE